MSETLTLEKPADEFLAGFLSRMEKLAEQSRQEFEKRLAAVPAETTCKRHTDQTTPLDPRRSWDATAEAMRFTPVYEPCPLCKAAERLERQNERLISQGIPRSLAHASFRNWLPSTDPNLLKVQEFAEKVRRGFLILLGDAGLGKTHLAVAAMRCFDSGFFAKQNTFLRMLRATYKDEKAPDPVKLSQNADIFVLDEVGMSGGGKDEFPALHEALDYRYNCKAPTIITANSDYDGLKSMLGDRLADRLKESAFAIIAFTGESKRGKQRERYFDLGL